MTICFICKNDRGDTEPVHFNMERETFGADVCRGCIQRIEADKIPGVTLDVRKTVYWRGPTIQGERY